MKKLKEKIAHMLPFGEDEVIDSFCSFDEWMGVCAEDIEWEVQEVYRNADGNLGSLDRHVLSDLLEAAFNAGVHVGAENPYC